MNTVVFPPAASSPYDEDADALPREKPALNVGIVLMDQFTLAAFAGLVDVLRLAGDHGGRSRQIHTSWRVMSWDGKPRCASAGLTIDVADGLPADPAEFDYVAVCGGNDYHNGRMPEPLRDWLRLAAARRVRLLGICTGTFALAQAGVVGPRTVCVHWNVLDAFRERFPQTRAVVDRLFVDEGDLISCAGSTAAIDLALYLVARHCGRDKAQQAMRHMMLQGVRPGRVPQAHFRTDLSGIQDLRVRQAAHFIEQRIDNPPPLDAIARYVGVGRRQLERAFRLATGKSPMAFQRQLRLEYGSWLLLNNPCSITQIALDCGFADGAHFSRDFRAHFGLSPRQYQQARGLLAVGQEGGAEDFPA
ncbi:MULTISPECIES: GlxA family transcriptional regulator [Achromobacter]|uniref:GlxA family transcriptional regulator n=1 Tax=Achromobacter spanius TaxID=217203 RepID=A0ABY8H0R2_9BURK|nr:MULTISPECIES: GlxA family transcriptional regulator [Achromobacter]WAI85636.1 GlxA family transcriptional regulator [Achromobacter spanius]WEX95718.1 GlxA family transcriptional regulator [Achromobacter sp. SS2-2022]WFP10562.1 GlxA family transcriptional regulator [Achromobacter spanius]